MASVQKYGSGWSIRYRVTDALGNSFQKRVSGFRTKEEAWENARKLEANSNAGVDVHGDRATCGLIMERWFQEHALPGLQATTISRYSYAIEILSTLPVYSEPVSHLTPARYSQMIQAMQMRNPERPISVTTACGYLDPLRLSLSWAARQGIIPRDPIAGYRRPTSIPRAQRILDEDDVADLVAVSKGKPIRISLLLALYGGLRREECAGLLWSNVNFKRGTVTICRAETSTVERVRVVKMVKTHHSMRTVTLPDFVMQELKAAPKDSEYVCVGHRGTPYALDSYRQAIHRIVDNINKSRETPMPDITFHDLRHTHAAMLIKLNVQPKVIQERLGHASIAITMDRYGYLMTGLQESVASALEFQIQMSRHNSRHTTPKTGLKTSKNTASSEIPKAQKSKENQGFPA